MSITPTLHRTFHHQLLCLFSSSFCTSCSCSCSFSTRPLSGFPAQSPVLQANPAEASQTHHSRPHSVKSPYFVSVHPMQKQQKLDIRLPPDVYVKTHNYSLAGSNPAYLYPVLHTGLRPFRFSSLLCLCERPALAYSLELNHVGKDAALKQ